LDDGGDYPNVGMMGVFLNGQPFFICSGTLIHPRVFLTAGHCTDNTTLFEQFGEVTIAVTFHYDAYSLEAEFLPVEDYFTHPDYNWGPRSNPHDVGALILESSVENIDQAALPPHEGYLDQLKREGMLGRGSTKAKFTVVGYGAILAWPPPLMINSDFKRRYAESEYRALLPAWLRLSQNHATDDEGTCFGDSGGPAFYTDSAGNRILVGTISWGDPNCISTGFNYRTDITETMEFIEDVINYAENVQQ
jgi:hypothetical protein